MRERRKGQKREKDKKLDLNFFSRRLRVEKLQRWEEPGEFIKGQMPWGRLKCLQECQINAVMRETLVKHWVCCPKLPPSKARWESAPLQLVQVKKNPPTLELSHHDPTYCDSSSLLPQNLWTLDKTCPFPHAVKGRSGCLWCTDPQKAFGKHQ